MEFPKSSRSGEVRQTKVREILERPTYAGYIEAPNWGVSLRKCHHEPLISFVTFERIQDALKSGMNAPARKDSPRTAPCAASCSATIATSP
ncbi:MAG: recombinase family protein [Paracoccaceae bacterium]